MGSQLRSSLLTMRRVESPAADVGASLGKSAPCVGGMRAEQRLRIVALVKEIVEFFPPSRTSGMLVCEPRGHTPRTEGMFSHNPSPGAWERVSCTCNDFRGLLLLLLFHEDESGSPGMNYETLR